MLELKEISHKELAATHLDAYAAITPEIIERIKKIAEPLSGLTIIHLNATRFGGGVAEMLKDQVPLEQAAGLDSRRLVIENGAEFFKTTKKIHNLLQGQSGTLDEREKEIYMRGNAELASSLDKFLIDKPKAILIIHDPQPLAILGNLTAKNQAVLRIHIDLTEPNREIVNFLQPQISHYHEIIISNQSYEKSLAWDNHPPLIVIPPAINPLSSKNKPLAPNEAKKLLASFGVNPEKPLLAQVSRFDPWKDPIGAIDAYYHARNKIPNLQLIMAGIYEAKDDPQQAEIFEKTCQHAAGDRNVFFFFKPEDLNGLDQELFINAIQSASDVILQKSIREGFGLTVTEAMWKTKPVVAGITAGTMMQITNGENGFLISSAKEAGDTIAFLLENSSEREKIGAKAHESVREKFLLPRLVEDHLKLYRSLQ